MEKINIKELAERDDIIINITTEQLKAFADYIIEKEVNQKYLSIKDVALILHRTPQTIYNYIRNGVLKPSVKLHRRNYFDREYIQKFASHYGTRNYRMALSEIREDNGI